MQINEVWVGEDGTTGKVVRVQEIGGLRMTQVRVDDRVDSESSLVSIFEEIDRTACWEGNPECDWSVEALDVQSMEAGPYFHVCLVHGTQGGRWRQ